MMVQYKINGTIPLTIDYTESGTPICPYLIYGDKKFKKPKIGQTLQPFMQDYQYEVISFYEPKNRNIYRFVINLKPKCESAKRVFEMQCPNFKNKD